MSSIIKYKKGDIISDFCNDGKALILQQNNCTATKIHVNSFAFKLFKKLPYSNPYNKRRNNLPYKNLAILTDRPKPGSIKLMYKDEKHPIVCCLFAQYRMGFPNSNYYINGKYTDNTYIKTPDDHKSRLEYFKKCLDNILDLFSTDQYIRKNINKIIIPRKIGCHSAGGNWKLYKREIIKFAKNINNCNKNIGVYIIKYQ